MVGIKKLLRMILFGDMERALRPILLVPAVLGPILLVRGIWALQQPWGVTYQKIVGLIFFFILWLVSLLLLFHHKLPLEARLIENGKWLFIAIGSATFILGGIFVIGIHPEQWIKGILSIGFFGLCFVVAVRNIRKT
jgi:hypothetical protein